LIAFVNGTVITPCRQIPDGVVLTQGDKIVAVGPRELMALPDGVVAVDARNGYIVPGYIDVHCHGAVGVSVDGDGASVSDLHRIAAFKAQHGTTSFLLAVPTGSPEAMLRTLGRIHEAVGVAGGAAILGAQAEGPYFSADAKGAQAVEHMRSPSIEEFEDWLRVCPELRLVSLAPEIEGALEFIAHARRRGVTVSVGHSRASYAQVIAAVGLGLHHATHTFNGMLGLHHRAPGTVGAILTCDEIMGEAVVDNIHLHPATVGLIVRCKGPQRTVLVTDAMSAAGLDDGVYTWDGRRVTVESGAVRLDDGTIAGSTLTMAQAVRNVLADTKLCLGEAIRMATLSPAFAIGIGARKGSLAAGKDADVVVLDKDLQVKLTMAAGTIVYTQLEGEAAS